MKLFSCLSWLYPKVFHPLGGWSLFLVRGKEAVILRRQTVRSFWEQDFYKAKLCASVSNSTVAYRTCRLASENPSSNVGRGTPIYGLDRV